MARQESTEARMTLYRLTGLPSIRDAIRERYLELDTFEEEPLTLDDREALLVMGRTEPKTVGWASLLSGLSGETVTLESSAAAAVLLIADTKSIESDGPYQDEDDSTGTDDADEPELITVWAVTFGMGFQLLNQDRMDNGFGQRIAIRSAYPLGLNSISKTTLDERPRIERSTIANGAPLRSFGFEDLGDLATRLVTEGKIDGVGASGKVVKIRGSDSLSLPLSKNIRSLLSDLESIKKVLAKKPASEELAALEQLALVKDKNRINELDGKLIEAIVEDDSALLALAFPHEMADEYGNVDAYKLLGTRDREPRDYLPTLNDILSPIREVSAGRRLKKLDTLAIALFENTDDDSPSSSRIPVKKWLAFQTEIDGRRYFLHNGRWYLMDRNYAEIVKRRTHAIFDRGPYFDDLPPWSLVKVPDDEAQQKRKNAELAYNKILAEHVDGLCLDQKLIKSETHKHGIEACDVLLKDGVFVHVKHVDASSPASHLLAQALVSAEVLSYDKTAQENLAERITEAGANPDDYRLEPSKIVIVMAREKSLLSADSLFTFTQVNLSRQVAQLNKQQIDVYVAPILREWDEIETD
ncbi:DUF6119 family protein [Arthrobacter sp. LS16]|uniref:DUF6119 family protein n=1 Tax=Arthrobacter sp. 'calajunan' TaxID=1690248 RepID=UPI003C78692E